jgi:hypothetical protein
MRQAARIAKKFIGAMTLLTKEPEISFNTIASTAGAELIKAARACQNP